MLPLLLAACRTMAPESAPAPPTPTDARALELRWLQGPGVILAASGGDVLTLLRREPLPDGPLRLDRYATPDDPPQSQDLPGPQPPDWGNDLAVLVREHAWLVRSKDPGDGAPELRRLPDEGLGVVSLVLDGDDARFNTVSPLGDGLLLGGWRGIHSNEQAFDGLVVQTDARGRVQDQWALPVRPEAQEPPGFESSVDELGAGGWIAGHFSPPGGVGERTGIWIATLEDQNVRGPRVLPGQNAQRDALALMPVDGACWLAHVERDTLRLWQVGADLQTRQSVDVPIQSGDPVVQLALRQTEVGLQVVLWRVQKGAGGLEVLELEGSPLTLTETRSLILPPRAVMVGLVDLGGRGLLVGHGQDGSLRAGFLVEL